jgi:hypothetical protein
MKPASATRHDQCHVETCRILTDPLRLVQPAVVGSTLLETES